jgi:hypothetical protein
MKQERVNHLYAWGKNIHVKRTANAKACGQEQTYPFEKQQRCSVAAGEKNNMRSQRKEVRAGHHAGD